MHPLCLDGSGSVGNPAERHFVLAGTAVFERLADFLVRAIRRLYAQNDTRYIDRVAGRFDSEGAVIHGLVHFKPPAEALHVFRQPVSKASGIERETGGKRLSPIRSLR